MWTAEQDKYLIENYATTDIYVMQAHLGKTIPAITGRANHKFNLKKTIKRPAVSTWTDAEIQFLHDNYPAMSIMSIASKLKRSESGVSNKLVAIGLYVKSKNHSSGKHYAKCLTKEQSRRMGVFLTLLTRTKRVADKLGKKANIDLAQMVEAYRVAVG